MTRKEILKYSLFAILLFLLASCAGQVGPQGEPGPAGPTGPQGPAGEGLTEEQLAILEQASALASVIDLSASRPRGCPSCHVLVDADSGAYTLAYEAHVRAEAYGGEHPMVAPDGTSLAATEEVNVTTCLLCHAPGTGDREGLGNVAPIALRDIVHPAHMASQYFKLHYGGNCFTCHNVDGEGGWDLLTEAVETNDKGVPDHHDLPIPGAIDID